MDEKIGSESPEINDVRNIEQRFWEASPDTKSPWNINVIGVAVHPSGIRTITPFIDEVISRGSRAVLITGEVATDMAHFQKFVREPDVRGGMSIQQNDIFSRYVPTLFLCSGSGGPEMQLETYLTLEVIHNKKQFGKTIICFAEHDTGVLMGSLLVLDQKGVNLGEDIDAFFMSERQSTHIYTDDAFLKIPHEKFITTGPIGWDALRTENTEEVNRGMRNKMEIDQNTIVISYFAERGHDDWSEMEIDTTPALIYAVINFAQNHPDRKVCCMYRFHPGDSHPEILNQLIAKNLPKDLPKNLEFIITQPDQSIKEDNRLISAMSNVSTSSYSTALMGPSLRGCRRSNYSQTGQMPIYYLSPIVREQIALSHYEIPASVQEGAAAFSDTPDGLALVIEKALFNNMFRRDIFSHQANELRNRYRFKGVETSVGRGLMQIRYLLRHL